MVLRAARRLAPARLGLAAALAVGLILLLVGGVQAWHAVRGWLHAREVYRADFLQIELVSPPPPWIKPGREGLLKAMLARAEGLDRHQSTPDLDLATLDRTFLQLCPWIESVERIERSYPNRLTVRVREYREPVAMVVSEGPAAPIVLDAKGHVLPPDEIDWEAAGPLLKLRGLPAADDARAGHLLKLKDAGPSPSNDRRVERLARLAGFLKPLLNREGREAPPIKVRFLRPGEASLWIKLDDGSWINWGEAPGEETPGNAPASRKWDLLREWLDAHGGKGVARPQYLDVSRDRVETRN